MNRYPMGPELDELIAALVMDGRPGHYSTDMADAWLIVDKMEKEGYCPALLSDDNGHWAFATDGIQNVPLGEEPEDIETTFFVPKNRWADSAPLAICWAARDIYDNESGEGIGEDADGGAVSSDEGTASAP